MDDQDELRVRASADVSELKAGFEDGANAVQENIAKMVQATLDIKQSTKDLSYIYKEYGTDVATATELATESLQRQADAQARLIAAKAGLKAALKEQSAATVEITADLVAATAAEAAFGEVGEVAGNQAARGFYNARAAATGLFSEVGLHGNRAMSSFLAQSSSLGPLLSAAFSGIAILGFIELAVQAGHKLGELIADTFIFTDAMKEMYKLEVAYNHDLEKVLDAERVLRHDIFVDAHDGVTNANKDLQDQNAVVDQNLSHLKSLERQLDAINARKPTFASGNSWMDEQGHSVSRPGYREEMEKQLTTLQNQVNLAKENLQISTLQLEKDQQKVTQAKEAASKQGESDHKQQASEVMQTWSVAAESIKSNLGDAFKTSSDLLDFWNSKLPEAAKLGSKQEQEVQKQIDTALKSMSAESLQTELNSVERQVAGTRAGSQERINIIQEEMGKLNALGLEHTNQYEHLATQLETAEREAEDKKKQAQLTAETVKVQATRAGTLQRVQVLSDEVAKAAELYGVDSEQYERALAKKAQAERDYARQVLAIKTLTIEEGLAAQQSSDKVTETRINSLASLGFESKQDQLAQLKQLHAQEFIEEKTAMERRIDLLQQDPTVTPAALQRAKDQLLAIDQKYQVQVAQDEAASLQARLAHVMNFIQAVNSNWQSSLNGYLQGTQTLGQAVRKVWAGIAIAAIDEIASIAEAWIMKHVIMRAVAAIFHLDYAAETAAASTAATLAHNTANVAMVFSDAVLAAASTFAALSPLALIDPPAPYIGAAVAYAAVADMAPAAAFEHGGFVEHDMTARLHAKEMVLDAPITRGLQNLISAGGLNPPNKQSGDIHFHNTSQVSAWDGKDVKRALEQHSDILAEVMAGQFKEMVRNGRFKS